MDPSRVVPGDLPLRRGPRPLKRWRYVGVFGPDLMACAAIVHVGPARQIFWALLTRDPPPGDLAAPRPTRSRRSLESPGLRERTHMMPWTRRLGSGAVSLDSGRAQIADAGVKLDLSLEEAPGIQAQCPHGRAWVWTRKQAGVRAHGTLALDGGPPRPVEALAVIDDTAGYHARVTEWWWAAGVGVGSDGRPLAFNLVSGVNDPPAGSERAVWVAGVPHEPPPVRFASDLSAIEADDGSTLQFAPEAEREHHDNLLIVRSDYRAPFGTFTGHLPGGIALVDGLGVMEHHRARW
jgi:hypothetical protein